MLALGSGALLCGGYASAPGDEPLRGPALPHEPLASAPAPEPSIAASAAPPVIEARVEIVPDAGAPAPPVVPGDPGCPDAMARAGRFCIDRYEAHLVTRAEDGVVTRVPHVDRPQKGVVYEARSAPGVFPQAYISRVESQAACKAAGKRLCSMAEWSRACRGKRWTTYPYGQREVAGRCNTGKPHLLPVRFGNNAKLWKYDEHFNSPELDLEPGFLGKSGEHEECVSEFGVYDMVGNLHEWVSDSVDEQLMERLGDEDVERNEQPWHTGNGVFLGGFFSTNRQLGPGCRFVTVAHEPRYHDYSTGFRCCAAAAPDPPGAKPEVKGAAKKP